MPKFPHLAKVLIGFYLLPLLLAEDLTRNNAESLTSNFQAREVTIPPIVSTHPRILLTPTDVSEIKSVISKRAEPRYSSWLNLKSRADRLIHEPLAPPYTGKDSLMFYNLAKGAGNRTSQLALAFLLDGNTAYAAKGKMILLAWAWASPLPASSFASEIRFVSSGMDTARGMIGFIYAYDGLYHTLLPAERTVVETWFQAMLPSIHHDIDRWSSSF